MIKTFIIIVILTQSLFSHDLLVKGGFLSSFPYRNVSNYPKATQNFILEQDTKYKFGYDFEISYVFDLFYSFGIQIGVGFIEKGFKNIYKVPVYDSIPPYYVGTFDYIENYSLYYVQIPILINYILKNRLLFNFGTSIEYFLSGNMTSTFRDSDVVSDKNVYFSYFDYGILLGSEYRLPKNFLIGINYFIGLSDLNKDESYFLGIYKFRTIQFYLGYNFKKLLF